MGNAIPLVEVWRGALLESAHSGHAVICDGSGNIVAAWGDPEAVIYPRSACKMIQALPLVTSGAADRYGLTTEQLALSCASHNGAAIHTDRVTKWLDQLGLAEPDLRCGPQDPADTEAHEGLILAHEKPCQIHNNCSGKHSGFLTLNQYMGGGPEYTEVDHPVQQAALAAFEETTGESSPGYGIDGCSAPNFATSVHGLARAMGWFASAHTRSDQASSAAVRLVDAMRSHPELVAGEGRACTALMRAMHHKAAVKTGAEGVFTGIIPELGLGVALKITDGATRASECTMTAILVMLGLIDAESPVARTYCNAPLRSRRGLEAGEVRPVAGFIRPL